MSQVLGAARCRAFTKARAQAELPKLQPPCFAKQVFAGLGQDGR